MNLMLNSCVISGTFRIHFYPVLLPNVCSRYLPYGQNSGNDEIITFIIKQIQ